MAVEIVAGRKTGVRRAGGGVPTLLLHCSLAHSGAWSGVMAGLQDRLQMAAVDLPGHGATEYVADVEVQAQACETAIAILEHFDQPAHVIGHSFGATVALRVAIMRPDLVASLALYEPVYFSLLASGDPVAHMQEVVDSREFIDCALADDWRGAADAFLGRWGGGFRLKDVPVEQQEFILQVLPFLTAPENPIIESGAGDKILAALPALKMPCLLMEGAESPLVVSRINAVLAAHMPNTQTHVFAGAAHMGPITHAAEVARVIGMFLFGDDA